MGYGKDKYEAKEYKHIPEKRMVNKEEGCFVTQCKTDSFKKKTAYQEDKYWEGKGKKITESKGSKKWKMKKQI